MTEIKLITSDTCPFCLIAKAKLLARNIKYKEINIRSPEGQELVKKFNIKSVPTLIKGDKLVCRGVPDEKCLKELEEDV